MTLEKKRKQKEYEAFLEDYRWLVSCILFVVKKTWSMNVNTNRLTAAEKDVFRNHRG